MFPFLTNNGYINPTFPFNMNYDNFRLTNPEENPYFYPFNNPNYHLSHESNFPNYVTHLQMPHLFERNHQFIPKSIPLVKKKKRIIKKLIFIEAKKNFRGLNSQFKNKRKTFKYFDPSRAPPITSLRNHQQLLIDINLQEQKTGTQNSNQQQLNLKMQESLRKLQILLKQPNQRNYPFLICKKRKYHRNLKRRYSVAYFQQRASFIASKLPIPPSLHPKNKVRKPRKPKNNVQGISQSSDESISSDYSQMGEQSDNIINQNEKMRAVSLKVEKNGPLSRIQIKQEIQSDQ